MSRTLSIAVLWLGIWAGAGVAGEPPLRIDDFEDLDLEAAPGLSWIAIGDWLVGGASAGSIAAIRLPASDASRGALRIEGRLRNGKRSFVGAWTALRGDGVGRDLRGYRALRFRARGTPGRYLAGVRRAEGRQSANFMAPITVTATWADVELPLSDLRAIPPSRLAFAPTGVTWIGVSADAGSPKAFTLDVDAVELVPEAVDPPLVRTLRLTDPHALARLAFESVGRDPRGDTVSSRLPDARELQLAVDAEGRVWFRFVLDGPVPAAWLGVNVALDVDGDPANGAAWWGQNQGFHYDRLVTAYLYRGARTWQGALGVADAAQIAAGRVAGLSADVRVAVDRARHTIAVGVPRAALGLGPGGRARLVGTVGSSVTFNDDVPGKGALEVTIPERGSVSH